VEYVDVLGSQPPVNIVNHEKVEENLGNSWGVNHQDLPLTSLDLR
jgi:hypothetical protein